MGTGLENMTEVVLKVGLRGVEGYLKERLGWYCSEIVEIWLR